MTIARQVRTKSATSKRTISIDYTDKLDGSTLLVNPVTVSANGTTPPTISGATISTTALTINDESVAAGKAVTFVVDGGAPGTYRINISVDNDAATVETFNDTIILQNINEACA